MENNVLNIESLANTSAPNSSRMSKTAYINWVIFSLCFLVNLYIFKLPAGRGDGDLYLLSVMSGYLIQSAVLFLWAIVRAVKKQKSGIYFLSSVLLFLFGSIMFFFTFDYMLGDFRGI